MIAVNERSLMDRSPRIHCQLPTCKQSLPVHRSKLRGGGVGICVFDAETDVVAGLRQYKPHRTQAFCNGTVRQMRARITIHDTTQRQNARSPSLFHLSLRSVSTLGHRITAAGSQSHLWSLVSLSLQGSSSLLCWDACKLAHGVWPNVVLPVFLLVVERFSPQSVHHSPLLSVLGGSVRVNRVVQSAQICS